MTLFAFAAAGVVTILAIALIVLALVVYLVSIIIDLRKIAAGLADVLGGVGEIVQKTAPVNGVVTTINEHLDTGVDLLEGLLVKKAGIEDAVGLVEGLYPGSSALGFRKYPASRTTKPPRIGEVYTRGTLNLARLGREAPIAAASPTGPALRDAGYGSAAAAKLYPEARHTRPPSLPRSPVVGTGAPVQYGPHPPHTISWGPVPERRAAAPQPEPPPPQPQPPAPEPAAPQPQPAAPDAPRIIRWKRN